MSDFKTECTEWLEPLGYSLYSSDGSGKQFVFHSNNPVASRPQITCSIEGDKKWCQLLSAGVFKMFLALSTGRIQFKHPEIKKYIEVMSFYERQAMLNPPW